MAGVRLVACYAVTLYLIVLLIRVVLSWVPALPEPVRPLARLARAATDPLLVPLRRAIPPVSMGAAALDLSPLIVFFVVAWILRPLFCTG